MHVITNVESDLSDAGYEMDDVEHETEYTGDRAVNFQPAVQPPVTFTGLLYEEINDGKTVHKLLKKH